MSTETFEQVAHDFSVSMAEAREDLPTDLVLEQWVSGEHEPPDAATLNRIYIAPGQTPRIVKAMLDALRWIAPEEVHTTAVERLRRALDERKADGRAWPEWRPLTPQAVRRLAEALRQRREAAAKAQTPKPTKKRRSKSARR